MVKRNISFCLIAVLTLLIFFCNACKSEEIVPNDELDIAAASQLIHDAWKKYDTKGMTPLMQLFEEKSSFYVTALSDDGNGHYTVQAEITSPDISEAITQAQMDVNAFLSPEEIDTLLSDLVDKASPKTSTQELYLIYTDGDYHTEFTEEFIDAMYGYAFSVSLNAVGNILIVDDIHTEEAADDENG